MKYTIWAEPRTGGRKGIKEEVDTADSIEDAKYLVGEYMMAFGPTFKVWFQRSDCDVSGLAGNPEPDYVKKSPRDATNKELQNAIKWLMVERTLAIPEEQERMNDQILEIEMEWASRGLPMAEPGEGPPKIDGLGIVKSGQPLFELGQIVATPGTVGFGREELIAILERHHRGDWGDVDKDDWAANDRALEEGSRILSSYQVQGRKVWIITEADRSSTTFLLPNEY
jgi:hypothetical protein